MSEDKRVVSKAEECEIEAMYQKLSEEHVGLKIGSAIRLRMPERWLVRDSFESEADRLERLQRELGRRERQYAELMSKRMNRRLPMNLWDKCFLIGIVILSFCAAWSLAAVFAWKGWALPWFLR